MSLIRALIIEEGDAIYNFAAGLVKLVGRFNCKQNDTISSVSKELKPDVIFLDERLTGFDVKAFAESFALENPEVCVFVANDFGGGISYVYYPLACFRVGVLSRRHSCFDAFLHYYLVTNKECKKLGDKFGSKILEALARIMILTDETALMCRGRAALKDDFKR